ncbi:hypothetical protein V6N13_098239 [Hibiscus sabdariffa]|uniref:Uncharacterized protein n=1 Tax=Hibiscus sabdariffa TaxID=183260 RepID=A0ABR2ED67_9ROSI
MKTGELDKLEFEIIEISKKEMSRGKNGLWRLEICAGMVKLVAEFVVVVADAFGIVIDHRNDSNRAVVTTMPRRSDFAAPSVPFVGFLP